MNALEKRRSARRRILGYPRTVARGCSGNKWHGNGKGIMMYGYWEISGQKGDYSTSVQDEDKQNGREKNIQQSGNIVYRRYKARFENAAM